MFEWNETKRTQNQTKHGVDFLDAALIFENPVLVKEAPRKDYGEQRWIALGQSDGNVYVVTYTMRGDTTRIISAWQGGRKEYEQYKKGVP